MDAKQLHRFEMFIGEILINCMVIFGWFNSKGICYFSSISVISNGIGSGHYAHISIGDDNNNCFVMKKLFLCSIGKEVIAAHIMVYINIKRKFMLWLYKLELVLTLNKTKLLLWIDILELVLWLYKLE
eukprot:396492_1